MLSKKIKRSAAAFVVLGSTLLIVIAFFVPLFVISGKQIGSFVSKTPIFLDNIKHFLTNTPIIRQFELGNVDMSNILSSVSGVTSNFVNQSINLSANIAQAFVYMIAGILIVYYFMADKEKVKNGYLMLFPDTMKEKASDIISSISAKIGGYVVAQIATMSSVGIIMTIGLLSGFSRVFICVKGRQMYFKSSLMKLLLLLFLKCKVK